MPRARSRSSGPSFPGSSMRSFASSSAARSPIVSTPDAPQALFRPRAHARQPAHVERREKPGLPPRGHNREAARLAAVARDLGDDLAAGDAQRAGKARRAAHRRLYRLRNRARPAEVGGHLADVEVALVHPGSLDRRHHLAHRGPDRLRVLRVEPLARRDEDRLRATAECLRARHRRVDPEPARHVVGRRHHPAAVRVAADDERLLPQLGLLELLHRSKERVEVEVRDDHGSPRFARRMGTPSRLAANGTVLPWTITEKATTTNTIP